MLKLFKPLVRSEAVLFNTTRAKLCAWGCFGCKRISTFSDQTHVTYNYSQEQAKAILRPYDGIALTDHDLWTIFLREFYKNVTKDRIQFLVQEYNGNPERILKLKSFCKENGVGLVKIKMAYLRQAVEDMFPEPEKKALLMLLYRRMFLVHSNHRDEDKPLFIKNFVNVFDCSPMMFPVGGVIDGKVYSADVIYRLAKLSSLHDIRAEIRNLIDTPAMNIYKAINSQGSTLGRLISQLVTQKGLGDLRE